jgi:hypothetical protein
VCTVTYLPKNHHSFIVTHNRDEHHSRGVAHLPIRKTFPNAICLAPIDSNAGGTWIATSEQFTLCLLNGGFVKHKQNPPYRHSRGHIIFDFFSYKGVEHFVKDYSFDGIEPFTLILIQHDGRVVNELVFDGQQIHHVLIPQDIPHIWSSSTLYTEADRLKRITYFEKFIQKGILTQEEIISFHQNKYDLYDGEGIQINRNEILKTVSLTSISKSEVISMYYEDFLHSQKMSIEL